MNSRQVIVDNDMITVSLEWPHPEDCFIHADYKVDWTRKVLVESVGLWEGLTEDLKSEGIPCLYTYAYKDDEKHHKYLSIFDFEVVAEADDKYLFRRIL